MGNAQPLVLSADRWRGGPADRAPSPALAGTISNVMVENLTAQAENGVFISGRVGGVSSVSIKRMSLVILQNPPNNASFGPCNAHNYWPTSGAGGELGVAAPVDGVFIEYASSVHLQDVRITFLGEPKPGNKFGECVFADPNTTSGIATTGTMECHNSYM